MILGVGGRRERGANKLDRRGIYLGDWNASAQYVGRYHSCPVPAGGTKSGSQARVPWGTTYAISGASIGHDRIAACVLSELHNQLRGKKCEAFTADTKIRIQMLNQVRFYYPDASVVCDSNGPADSFQDRPVVMVEVLSQSTRRLDQGEKRDAYFTIPSLRAYLLVEQSSPHVTVFRRGDLAFERELYAGLDAVIPLPEVGCRLALKSVYERSEFDCAPAEG